MVEEMYDKQVEGPTLNLELDRAESKRPVADVSGRPSVQVKSA
jgi:hypothetical protein